MDFGSGFPAGSQQRIRVSLGVEGLLNYKMDKGGGDFLGYVRCAQNSGPIVQTEFNGAQFEVQSDDAGGDAFIAFHRKKNYATRFGLNGDSEFGFGGFSEARFWKLWTEKNFNPGSKVDKSGDTVSGPLIFNAQVSAVHQDTTPIATSSSNRSPVEVRGKGTGSAAFIEFHRPGEFGTYLGLDVDNQFKVGGWSMGPTAYKLWHEGNLSPIKKFVGVITGDGVKTSFDVVHNLNTTDFTFNVKDGSGYTSLVDVIPKDSNTATVVMGTPLNSSEIRKVVIIG